MDALIIGGSSGLGLELAKQLQSNGYTTHVTGRKDPKANGIIFHKLDLAGTTMVQKLEKLITSLPKLDLLVHAAGFYQEGRLTDLSDEQIEEMLNVGGRSLIYAMRSILKKQGELAELMVVTSTSQWIPRQIEPIYNFIKAGGGHFANAMAEDGRVGKVLVAGPAGMRTAFWRNDPGRDKSEMLEPSWVAEQMLTIGRRPYKYKYIRILRQPARIEEIEER